jgi:toxin-antitoxin system PIN domain toxin
VAFAWVVLLAFLRLGTNPSVFEAPLGPDEALDLIEGWLDQPPATVVNPTEAHPRVLRDLLEPLGTGGNLTTDAHLAALAIEHGATLVSFDRDFGRFPGLRWEEPS